MIANIPIIIKCYIKYFFVKNQFNIHTLYTYYESMNRKAKHVTRLC